MDLDGEALYRSQKDSKIGRNSSFEEEKISPLRNFFSSGHN